MAHHDVVFPLSISRDSTFGPCFDTKISETGGRWESRNQRCEYPLSQGDIAKGVCGRARLDEFRSFFLAIAHGKENSFLFHDWMDNRAVDYQNQNFPLLGTGDGAEQHFQLVKIYQFMGRTYTRTIKKPIGGSIEIYIAGAFQQSGWTVDFSTGIITITNPPGVGEAVTADFRFYVPCRLDRDDMTPEWYGPVREGGIAGNDLYYQSFPIVEVRL